MHRFAVATFALAAVLAAVLVAYAQNRGGETASGRLYAEAWCTECHSVSPETAGTGDFAPDFTVVAARRSTTVRSLKAFLNSAHNVMPDFVLTERETDDIAAYIVSLKRRR